MYAGLVAFIGMMGGMRIERIIYYGGTKAEEGYYGGEIEAAVCVASYTVLDVSSSDYHCPLGMLIGTSYGTGCGFLGGGVSISGGGQSGSSGGGARSGGGSEPTNPTGYVNRPAQGGLPAIRGEKSLVEKLVVALTRYKNQSDVLKALFESVDMKKVTIAIEVYDGNTVFNVKNDNGKQIITVACFDPEYCNPIIEELFHAYQYQQSPSWKSGDLEFEAKVFLWLTYDQTGLYFMDPDYLNPFKDFFEAPSKGSYDSAKQQLQSYPFCYSGNKYPHSVGYDKVLTHINELTNYGK